MNIELLKNKIKDKKVLYDHSTDKKLNKWQSNISLIKTSDDELPSYITKNREKFIDWLE